MTDRLPDAWPCLSLREPWLYAKLHLDKTVENRKWNTAYRGPIWLHRALSWSQRYEREAFDWMVARNLVPRGGIQGCDISFDVAVAYRERLPRPPPGGTLKNGIAGYAEIVDVIPPINHWRGTGETGRADLQEIRELLRKRGTEADLRWWMHEQFGFVLRNVKTVPFIKCPGRQRWFYLPRAIETRARASIHAA